MTDWNDRYRKGDMPWEKGRGAPPLDELLEMRGLEIWGNGHVIVPGCGFGHDVRTLAAAGLQATGLDLSEIAVARAMEFPLAGNERYEIGDFLDGKWSQGRKFSAIWEHTCFCAIDPSRRADYALAAAECLEPGGLLAGVFFLTPRDPGDPDEGPPFGTSIAELESCFAASFSLIEGWLPAAAYPGREGREWIGIFRRTSVPGVAG